MKKRVVAWFIGIVVFTGCFAPVLPVFADTTDEKKEVLQEGAGTIWNGDIDTSWYQKDKTYFKISAPEQLAGLAKLVNNGNTFAGKTVQLVSNITLNDTSYKNNWTSIGACQRRDTSKVNVFEGIFEGNGHSINGISTDTSCQGGLFGHIGKQGRVIAVNIRNGALNSGGCIANVNEGKIAFCNNFSTAGIVDGTSSYLGVGGICNDNYGLIYGCKNYGKVWGSDTGGIVGMNIQSGSISQCANLGQVDGSYSAAGIAAYNYAFIYNSYNRGTIGNTDGINTPRELSGIASHSTGTISNCYSAGIFSNTDYVFFGAYAICRGADSMNIRNCYVSDTVKANNQGVNRVSEAEMKSTDFISKIDQPIYSVLPAWRTDTKDQNSRFPVTEADVNASKGVYKIQPELWISDDQKLIKGKLSERTKVISLTYDYSDVKPVITVTDSQIADVVAENDGFKIHLKSAGTTKLLIKFTETKYTAAAEYSLTLKVTDDVKTPSKNTDNTKNNTDNQKNTDKNTQRIKSISLSKTSFTYNGKNRKPSVTVKDTKGNTLKKGTDYTVSYPKNCKKVGQYTVTIKFKGNYTGSTKKTYCIHPKGTSLSEVKAKSKSFTAKWKKQTTQTRGYRLQYATDKKFKKNVKNVTIKKNKTTSQTVKKLKAKKKYYVRIRTYQTIKVNGKEKKLYSDWSKTKNVTVKK